MSLSAIQFLSARLSFLKSALLIFLIAAGSYGQNYRAVKAVQDNVEVVILSDSAHAIEVKIVPSLGNRAIEMSVHGKNILHFPYRSVAEGVQHPGLNGIPFLAPWANRLDESGFWANSKEYLLNPGIGNLQKDGNGLPIHGLLSASSRWEIATIASDRSSARVTSRLLFWKYPDLMEQWPFAQEYEMSYVLSNGSLEVRTSVANRSAEPMPVTIGFHPYYRVPDKPRDEWTLRIPARKAVTADSKLIPTGEYKPVEFSQPVSLRDRRLDDGFTDLERDSSGRANFAIQAGPATIHIAFGPKFPVAILWNPLIKEGSDEFVCIEPMAGLTDAANLNHSGKYPGLQVLPPGQTWTESFWITPEGI